MAKKKEKQANDNLGTYFIRTSMDMKDEIIVWNVYNTIREIESTFRTPKSDLGLRPIYHKKTSQPSPIKIWGYWRVGW